MAPSRSGRSKSVSWAQGNGFDPSADSDGGGPLSLINANGQSLRKALISTHDASRRVQYEAHYVSRLCTRMLETHDSTAKVATVKEILPWRDLYRQEMNCQIIHDSLHSRKGWTEPYLLMSHGVAVGYGSVAVGGPWKGKPAVFEFYVAPPYRSRMFDLFIALLTACNATRIETQSNDSILTAMLHTFAQDVASESILFHDKFRTAHLPNGAIFRRAAAADAARVFPHQAEPVGDWVLEAEGMLAATGGILFHYNRPYGDIYMEVAEAFRKRGLGCYLVQELKRVCYEQGSVPAARCSPTNIPSRKTLQKAGFVPCGHILTGSVSLSGSGSDTGAPSE
jgi:GNAT superfamily N-acetyltransferase